MTGSYAWSSVVHQEREDGDGPLCGAISQFWWGRHTYLLRRAVTCKRCAACILRDVRERPRTRIVTAREFTRLLKDNDFLRIEAYPKRWKLLDGEMGRLRRTGTRIILREKDRFVQRLRPERVKEMFRRAARIAVPWEK